MPAPAAKHHVRNRGHARPPRRHRCTAPPYPPPSAATAASTPGWTRHDVTTRSQVNGGGPAEASDETAFGTIAVTVRPPVAGAHRTGQRQHWSRERRVGAPRQPPRSIDARLVLQPPHDYATRLPENLDNVEDLPTEEGQAGMTRRTVYRHLTKTARHGHTSDGRNRVACGRPARVTLDVEFMLSYHSSGGAHQIVHSIIRLRVGSGSNETSRGARPWCEVGVVLNG